MDLTARQVSSSLRSLDIRPTRGKGQNFLTSRAVVEQIADLVKATPRDIVVEVGPGLGALTEALAKRAGNVVAIELDDRLAEHLRQTSAHANLQVISGDALTIDPATFLPGSASYLFAANLPYSTGAAIVRRFLEMDRPPSRMVVMLQKEVAERMAAAPPDMSILGVAVQMYGRAEIALHVPPEAFKPRPKVDSAVLVIEPHITPLLPLSDRQAFFEIVHAGFHQKRKQLANTLAAGLRVPKTDVTALLLESGIEPQRRAETLEIHEWLTLFENWRHR
ncbi:MAG: 16S rRNA (adenine(1518)-N(6)/adenine(1519)-N(6))-dimethyltransferase RsmA [Thermomicrobiales bacterium]